MNSSSTHDTKRSEDVRARISVLSEMPDLWSETVQRWSAHNQKYKRDDWPDRNTEYLLYQTMIGAWPIPLERLQAYMEKACREGKQRTNWLSPNEQFESATRDFAGALYGDRGFLRDFESFVRPLIEPGRINSISQTLLKLTAPGVPDIYQGQELWDLSLVDPDNRRPVDYGLRRRLLTELPRLDARRVWCRIEEGLPKLWVIHHALRVRREHLQAFGPEGAYAALEAEGSKAEHLVGFTRGERVAVLAPRLNWQLARDWEETTVNLPAGEWRNELDGRHWAGSHVKLADVLAEFPVALLVSRQT